MLLSHHAVANSSYWTPISQTTWDEMRRPITVTNIRLISNNLRRVFTGPVTTSEGYKNLSFFMKHKTLKAHDTQPLGGQKLRCEQISLSITSFSDWAFPLHEDTERSVSKGFKARSESSQREWRWTSFSLPEQHVLQRQTSTSTSTIQVKPSVKRYRSVRDYLSSKLLTHQLLSAQHHSPPLYLTCPALPFNSAESKNIDG